MEVVGPAADDRHEVDDDIHPLAGLPERRRIGYVARCELDSPGHEPHSPRGLADEGAHRHVLRADRMRDVGTDEARAAGEENRHRESSKFCQ